MANNRLYIRDTQTGEKLLLAKSFGNGWALWESSVDKFEEWCASRDVQASYTNTGGPTMLELITEGEN
jgi:hypothetical protein